MLCLWLLLLGFALVTLALSDLFNRDRDNSYQKPGPPRRPLQRVPNPPDLEVVDYQDDALEFVVDLSPLNSLQEDQLLFVRSMQGTKSPPQRKGTYKVLLPVTNKHNSPATPTHGEMGKAVRLHLEGVERDKELSAAQKYGFNEMVSEKISLHRRLPETRHSK